MSLSTETLARIQQLSDKYTATGQDLNAYLDGLIHADYLSYWDYIQLDTLLTLQKPKTRFPDEKIFIIYHQITELYFTLILNELAQIKSNLTEENFILRLQRVNAYFDHLINSFEVMIEGMDKDQFLSFRMSLLPASGFQSVQYRKIEIASTFLSQLVHLEKRQGKSDDFEYCFENIYWRSGAVQLATGKKTFTLLQFEEKYNKSLHEWATSHVESHVSNCYAQYKKQYGSSVQIENLLRQHDLNANVRWNLMHYRSAVRYLQRKPEDIAATGGTNWQKYLPPKNQIIVFYPELWTNEQLQEWGKFETYAS